MTMIRIATLCALTVGCLEPAAEEEGPPPDSDALAVLGIDPATVSCAGISHELAEPPPAPFAEVDDDTAPRVCPDGFVPLYGDLDPERAYDDGRPPSAAYACPIGPTYYAGLGQARDNLSGYGAAATISIHDRPLHAACDMVTAEVSVVAGNNMSVVEIGWRRFWDPYPKLLIGHWRGGAFRDDAGFVYTHPTYRNNMSIASMVGSSRRFLIRQYQGNWWVWFDSAWVGYFPGSLWSYQFPRGDVHHWYGEVQSAWNSVPPRTDMGSGFPASDGRAATMTGMCTVDSAGSCQVRTAPTPWIRETNRSYYTLQRTSSASIRYGGSGGG